MGELENSLTPMDWLRNMAVGSSNRPDASRSPVQNNESSDATALDSDGDHDKPLLSHSASQSSELDGVKPAYSYANLITFAINSSPDKRMTLSEIYQWIVDKYPYYRDAENGWKVCVK